MRVFVTGFDVAKGKINDDVSISRPYFELGWEVVTTHLDLKHLKVIGKASENDLVVTASGREFLYRAEFCNVISFEAFGKTPTNEFDDIVYLTDRYSEGHIPSDYFDTLDKGPDSRFRFLFDDARIIQSIERVNLDHIALDAGYCCVAIRRRGHEPSRNLPKGVIQRILAALVERYSKVFVVGHGNLGLRALSGVIPVDLISFASLISDPRCDLVFGTMTGPIQLACLISRAATSAIIKLYDEYDVEAENDPICAGRSIQLSCSQFDFICPSDVADYLSAVRRLPPIR